SRGSSAGMLRRSVLRRSLGRAAAGRGQVVAIVGKAGMRKSCPHWEFIRSHHVDGRLVSAVFPTEPPANDGGSQSGPLGRRSSSSGSERCVAVSLPWGALVEGYAARLVFTLALRDGNDVVAARGFRSRPNHRALRSHVRRPDPSVAGF